MNENKKKVLVIVAVAIILTVIVYAISSGNITTNILRTETKNNAYADVTLVSPQNYALVDLPVTATVHVITNATNPLIQFTFKYIDDNGYTNYYKSIRFSFSNDTDISYTPTFDSSYANRVFEWYVVVFNGSKAIWYNSENPWHFTLGSETNQPPVADAGGTYYGGVNDTVTLDASNSYDPDGEIAKYEWDANNDGTYDIEGAKISITYPEVGNYTAKLRVTDNGGKTSVDTANIIISQDYVPQHDERDLTPFIVAIVLSIAILAIGVVYTKEVENE